MTSLEWGWYSAGSDLEYDYGPYSTINDALKEAIRGGVTGKIFFMEAAIKRLQLSDFIDVDKCIDDANAVAIERHSSGNVIDIIFNIKDWQREALHKRIKDTFDEWQEEYGIVFRGEIFEHIRNEGVIPCSEVETEK